MAKTLSGEHDLAAYALVADRITLFYERYPAGRIVTELVSRTEREITFRALVFRGAEDAHPAATGWASEREGDSQINEVACLENTETSAVGRALANLGFTASSRRPSREEMEKAARQRARLVPRPIVAAPVPVPHLPLDADPLQRRANAVHDVLGLIERAEAIGFSEQRGAAFRDAVFKEERVELAFEDKRWFQLLRTGRAVDVMKAHGADIKSYATGRRATVAYNVTPQMLLFPLPVREITNNGFQQNPGY